MKIMNETDKRREQIDEVIDYIEKRLNELEGEKSELKKYQELDTKKRCLQFTFYDKQLKQATEKLEKIEKNRYNNEVDFMFWRVLVAAFSIRLKICARHTGTTSKKSKISSTKLLAMQLQKGGMQKTNW